MTGLIKHKTVASALFASIISLAFAQQAFAQAQGDCGISYMRTACPGKEAQSYAKCDGQASCIKFVAADSAQACQTAALKACANDRLDITKSKVVGATYKGAPLKSATGKADFCEDYDKRAAEFDQCDSK
jgi:hypothetical protein